MAEDVRSDAASDGRTLVEIEEIVGESHRQDALAKLAGPKDEEGKHVQVGVVLRCDPTNSYDTNAIRVEALGQHVGFVSRDTAALMARAIPRVYGGALEGLGVIVGGWKHNRHDEGSYGIRVWITVDDAARLGLRPDRLDPSLRSPWPVLSPCTAGEVRISPTAADVRRRPLRA